MPVMFIVKAKSGLPEEELARRMEERRPRFLEIDGLLQKIYGRDENGYFCGMYFFRDRPALAAFRETELAKTIASAYEVTEIRVEAFDVMFPLREGVGPI